MPVRTPVAGLVDVDDRDDDVDGVSGRVEARVALAAVVGSGRRRDSRGTSLGDDQVRAGLGEGEVESADLVWDPVYTTTANVVAFEASTVLAQAVLSIVKGAEFALLEASSALTSLLKGEVFGKYGS